MNEFIDQFLLESRELVESATRELLALEQNPADVWTLDSVFRAFHTLKGGAGIVDFPAMARMVHAAEDVLVAVRAGTRTLTPALVGDCLQCLDQVTNWLITISANEALPADAEAGAEIVIARFSGRRAGTADDDRARRRLTESARAVLEAQVQLLAVTDVSGLEGRAASAARAAANALRCVGMPQRSGRIENETDPRFLSIEIARILDELVDQAPTSSGPAPPVSSDLAARTLRVDPERVDKLVDLTGELIIAKNAIGHTAKLAQDLDGHLVRDLKIQHAELDHLLAELQKAVLALRVLPMRQVFRRFPRLVREMSGTLGRPTRLVTEGDDTEADKAVVEALHEPLLHVLRNAMDHGVEPAEQRTRLGKPAVATIWLRAGRRGEHVVVEAEDDGRGVDIAKVRQVAIRRGLVSADVIAGYSEAEIVNLIFSPGFSTKSDISEISGRGVGMDAARAAIEALGGQISIESRAGHGSLVQFLLPFSVMMTRVMTVGVGDQVFGIPLEAVVETVRVGREAISAIGLSQAFVWRDRTIPVIDLSLTLNYQGKSRCSSAAILVITSIAGQLGAIEVDRLGERMDVMLRPMNGFLGETAGVLGATLIGDGRVLLVLDIHELLS